MLTLPQLGQLTDAARRHQAGQSILELNNLTAAIGAAVSEKGNASLKKWGKDLEKDLHD